MEIACRHHHRHTSLDLTGRCVISAGESEILPFRATIARLIAQGCVWVVANLKGLTSVDARGLGEFVRTHRLLRAAGGGLMLVAPNARIRKMLAVTRLDTFLPVCDGEPDTLQSPRASTTHATFLPRAGPAHG